MRVPYNPAPEPVRFELGPITVGTFWYEHEQERTFTLEDYQDRVNSMLQLLYALTGAVQRQDHPAPLCIDGHAYHRRTRARRKR